MDRKEKKDCKASGGLGHSVNIAKIMTSMALLTGVAGISNSLNVTFFLFFTFFVLRPGGIRLAIACLTTGSNLNKQHKYVENNT